MNQITAFPANICRIKATVAQAMADNRWRTADDIANRTGLDISDIKSALIWMVRTGLLHAEHPGEGKVYMYQAAQQVEAKPQTPAITQAAQRSTVSASGLRQYTRQEARAIEDSWVRRMPGAGKPGGGSAPLNSIYGEIPNSNRARVMDVIKRHGPITVVEALDHLPDLEKRTVRTCVARLSERAKIKQVRRAVWVAV